MLELLEEVHSRAKQLDASMIVASEKGVHWNAVRAAARHIKRVAEKSPRSQGTFNFAATAMLGPGAPFYPGSWHADQGGRFSVGLQAANVVAGVFASSRGDAPAATRQLGDALSAHANDVHRISRAAEAATGWKYWGFDSTPAPLKDDSIGAAMESLYASHFGAAGTMTAAYVITQAQQQIPEPRIGYAGLMLPVLEDSLLARRWSEGAINIDSLLAYSAVCGTGLDTVPLPGDVTEEQLVRILGDMAVLAFKWKKPLTARLQPVHGGQSRGNECVRRSVSGECKVAAAQVAAFRARRLACKRLRRKLQTVREERDRMIEADERDELQNLLDAVGFARSAQTSSEMVAASCSSSTSRISSLSPGSHASLAASLVTMA